MQISHHAPSSYLIQWSPDRRIEVTLALHKLPKKKEHQYTQRIRRPCVANDSMQNISQRELQLDKSPTTELETLIFSEYVSWLSK